MHRRAAVLLLSAAVLCPAASSAQRREALPRPSGPPHAWLFGTWTGGLFPVLEGMLDQDCRTQPTVVFSQDVVGHTSLTAGGVTQRVIETVRTTPNGAEFRFSPDPADTGAFGCEDGDVLHVARNGDNEVSFPHCTGFPYPLQRCPGAG